MLLGDHVNGASRLINIDPWAVLNEVYSRAKRTASGEIAMF
jgi:hypothetical protein